MSVEHDPPQEIDSDLPAALPENADGLSALDRVQARWNREHWHSQEGPRDRAHAAMVKASVGQITEADFERILLEERLRDAELFAIRAQRPKAPAIHESTREMSAPVIEAALLSRLGHESLAEKTLGPQAMQRGRDLRATHILDILKAALQLEDRPLPATPDAMIRAAFSTASVPNILSNVANKLLLSAYTAFPSAARMIARKLTANDFKTHTGVRLTGDATMKPVGPAGELAHGTLTDAAFTFSVGTFGRIFGLNRQELRNDDLSAFEQLPRILGRGAALALEDAFCTLVLANTSTFFGTGNNNYISGADTALSLTALGKGVETMLKQVDADGNPTNVVPRYLLVPPELKATADALYRSTTVVLAGSTDARLPGANTFFGLHEPATSPYLSNSGYTGNSATAWYLFGDPADVAAFGIAYLDGLENPVIEQVEQAPDVLGIGWRGYLDFGVCQIDSRGGVRSKGAA